jgi:acetolactate synthase I/II/III large subunit
MDTCAKFLIDYLLEKGIDTYFGIPGGPVAPLFDAVLRTPGVTLVESKHETAGVFEAIGYYRATGKVPVVVVSAGPGITNTLTGIASAKALRVPMIVISGDVAWDKDNFILLQAGGPEGLDLETTFKPHTEKVVRITDSNRLVQQVSDLLTARKGNAPLLIVLPLHVSNVKIEKPEVNDSIKPTYSISKQLSEHYIICEKLLNAKRPLIILGHGARTCPIDKLETFLHNINIPFVTTPQAKGIVSENDPLSLRHAGLAASQWIREYTQQTPDVVLVLGTDLDDCAVGSSELIGPNTFLIHIDTNSKVFNRKYKTHIGILQSIEEFLNGVNSIPLFSPLRVDLSFKKNSAYDVADFRTDESLPIAPHRAIADLQLSAPPEVRFVTDIGEHMLFCLHYLTIRSNTQFSIDLGLGSMGSGICQAIGMCLGDKRPTICVCGDGGIQMHGMEVLTAIKHKLPIIFAIFNDGRYNMVHHGFRFMYGREEKIGYTDMIDFVKMFEAMGVPGALITSPNQINQELISSFLNNGPAILDIRINKDIKIKGAGRNEALKQMGEYDA